VISNLFEGNVVIGSQLGFGGSGRRSGYADRITHGHGGRYGRPGRYWFHSLWVIVGVVLQIRAVTLSTLVSRNRTVCRSWRWPGCARPG
jgi:hypothetical protein